MVNLYNDPHGEKVFQKTNPSAVQESSSGTGLSLPTKRRPTKAESQEKEDFVPQLQKRVRELEEEVAVKERKIKELEMELSSIKVCEM